MYVSNTVGLFIRNLASAYVLAYLSGCDKSAYLA